MSSQQHNPNLHHDTTVYEIGKGVAWLVAFVFMLMLMIPPVLQHVSFIKEGKFAESPVGKLVSWRPAQEPLIDRLHSIERGLDSSGYSTALRQGLQGVLTSEVGEGNRKTFIGFDGWLYYQSDLRALTGFGPLRPEPFSVMKDPELAKLPETKDVVTGFAKQLEERGIKLLLVPLPLKPMIYPEYVSPSIQLEWLTHPDAPAYYEELRKSGIDVLDLTADLAKLRSTRRHVYVREPDSKDKEAVAQAKQDAAKMTEVFLKQDTHWTPEAMRAAAEIIANHVKNKHPEALRPGAEMIRAADGIERSSMGDLVKLIDLKDAATAFTAEKAFLRVIGENTLDRTSPVVLLGDSFVNIFDDPTLGFDDPAVDDKDEKSIRAGFAQHLSLLLQQPLDVIAMNGAGATGVRRELARRYDDDVRSKKLVVWVIASRDLLLSRTAAHHANIEWAHVNFNPNKNPKPATPTDSSTPPAPVEAQTLIVEATLSEKSKNQDPNGTPYRDALHAAVYDIEKVTTGKLDAAQVVGVQWTFRDKVMQPTSTFTTGTKYRLTLVPWDDKTDLQGLNLEDETSVFDAPRYFVEKAEPIQ